MSNPYRSDYRGFVDLQDDGRPWTHETISEYFAQHASEPVLMTVQRERTWRERLLSWPWRLWRAWTTEIRGPFTVTRDGLSFIISEPPT